MSAIVETISLSQKFSLFSEQWTPKIIAELNGQYVKLAKVQGDFVWHDHAEEDEMFFVVKGNLFIDFREGETQKIGPGEILVVPSGVEHRPWTKPDEEVHLLLFEPKSTAHTGEVEDERTVKDLDWI